MTKANWDNPETEDLFRVISKLGGVSGVRAFLRDLLTEQELIEFSKRWKAAKLLSQRVPYTKIVKQTGLSSTTVARVQKWLTKGMNGYKKAIKQEIHHHAPILIERG